MKIIKCNCVHAFQDKTYGLHFRVATQKLTGVGKPKQYVCTVCGKVHA